MRVLLDECLPKKLKRELVGHTVITVPEQGWASKKNGELLQLADNEFDVFLTVDQNLIAQQNLSNRNIAVVVLVASSNRLQALKPLMLQVQTVLETIQPGEVVCIP
ncbi:DUF5615 family PIN-like protein [Microseira sp. BLCC-F43]|jgi:predicted nuclease of predicted toxin-antitoxin system|uniref:DUF5615 family PIN-like protein n=1 Tax=Microseira sp. BLCC-F43 TaxID=3153602 RepID=UPI0035B877C0